MKRKVKVGVNVGGGPPPKYKWNVEYLKDARKETMGFLDESQYHHVVDQIKELARHTDPTHSSVLDIDAIEDFFELRDKGGRLGKINVRIYYFVNKDTNTIVVLGGMKKETENQTREFDKTRIRRRKRQYLNNEFNTG